MAAALLMAQPLLASGMPTSRAAPPQSDSHCPKTAAEAMGWGAPNREDDFDSPKSLANWWVYDSAGHDGNGRRTPSAVSVVDGTLVISGDPDGNSGGVAQRGGGQMFGRWEVCVKSPLASVQYHSVALLWPDANDWPVGGEVDFMEIKDPNRQNVEFNLHSGVDDQRVTDNMQIDATQWHSWAVEWAPDHITAYVDGVEWAEVRDASRLPPRSMHLCLQLDNFGGDVSVGGQQFVDWAREYPVPAA